MEEARGGTSFTGAQGLINKSIGLARIAISNVHHTKLARSTNASFKKALDSGVLHR